MGNLVFDEKLGDIAIGLYDIPYSPDATVLYLNLLKHNAVIFGGSMSGKTTMVKSILVRMNEEQPYAEWENTYILDFGGNIGEYSDLGRVCAYFDNSNEENVKRIFKTVEQRLTENNRALNGENYLSYQQKNPDNPLPHITLILENVTAFLGEERYSVYHSILTKLVRDGISKGVSVVVTATDVTGLLNRMMVHFNRKYALEMQKDKYLEIFNTKVDEPMKVPGRGVTIVDSRPCEFQAFLPFEDEAELKTLILQSRKNGVEKLKSFPPELTPNNLSEYCPQIEEVSADVLVGLDYYHHSPITLDFKETHNIAIYGKKQFGKTNLLRLIMNGAFKKYPNARYIFFDDGREQLKEFFEICKKTNKKVECVTQFNEFRAILRNLMETSGATAEEPVFMIVQNKMLFRQKNINRDGVINSKFYLTNALTQAHERNYYFIFSDVPSITESDTYDEFNSLINVAFLLDSIGDFLAEKGKSTVFNSMEPKEMKLEYARCEIGDGFYYDVDRENLQKMKVIKSD